MAIFNNMQITTAGQILYTKAQAGKPIKFTKMQLGSGDINAQNPQTLIALINPQFDVPISSISNNTEQKTATISGIIDNSAITKATYICEIGLWAKDPDAGEILYSYASAGTQGDYMAPASQGAYSWSYQINAAIGNAANVTAVIDSSTYDYGVVISDKVFNCLSGSNQKEINRSIDNELSQRPLKSELPNLDNIVSTINKKIELTIAEKLPPIANRQKHCLYFKITDKQSNEINTGAGVKVSPTMAIRKVE